jgi:hypothetical protein
MAGGVFSPGHFYKLFNAIFRMILQSKNIHPDVSLFACIIYNNKYQPDSAVNRGCILNECRQRLGWQQYQYGGI